MNCAVCDKKLRIDNKIGTCRKHRGRSSIRREYEKSWQQDNLAQYRDAKNKWTRNNPGYFAEYRNRTLHNKVAHSLRVRIRRAVKKGSAVKNLGCSIQQLIVHLESQFTSGMTWENYGLWHIDHIRPLSSFDLSNPDELRLACVYTNLQPLWAEDNIRKHAKLEYNAPTSALQAKKSA